MYMVDPPHATGALIAAVYKAGAKIMNLTRVLDLILRNDGSLEGVVVNNTTAEMAGHDIIHVDPIALESKIVVDATGHDAIVVELLHKRNRYQRFQETEPCGYHGRKKKSWTERERCTPTAL